MPNKAHKVGQAFHPAAFIHDTPEGIALLERFIREYEIGGLTFFYSRESVETNFDRKTFTREKDSIQQLARMVDHYQSISREPLLMSIDAEWGLGMRIDTHPPFPHPLNLAATNQPDLMFEVGRAIALELKAVGIHFNLAPVVDVNANPANPVIGYRSFGEDPARVFELAHAYYEGMKSEGILGCVKHFPGHGDTAVDSHLGLPKIEKDMDALQQMELAPFKGFIEKGVDCVMVGHLLMPALDAEKPASLSSKVIEGLIRQQLGFDGPVMTDALNMRSILSEDRIGQLSCQAFAAGNDILSFSNDLEEAYALIMQEVAEAKIEASYQRVRSLKEKAGILSGATAPTGKVPDSTPLRTRLAQAVVTVQKPLSQSMSSEDLLITWFNTPGPAFDQLDKLTIAKVAQLSEVEEAIAKHEYVYVAVYPPSQKPGGQFGMDPALLEALNGIIAQKKVHLAWLGNAYALAYVDWNACESVVIGYQPLPEIETEVLQYWQGRSKPGGKLVVSLPR